MWNAQIHCYYCTNNSATVDVHGPIEPKCDTPVPGRSRCNRIRHEWPILTYTLQMMPKPQHTRMSIGCRKDKNMFWRNKLLIYSTNKNERDRLKENRVLYETFDNHCSLCLNIFVNKPFVFSKRIFTPSATRKALASILSCGTVLPAPCGKEILWQNLVLLMFK